jgi:hypothetical protein
MACIVLTDSVCSPTGTGVETLSSPASKASTTDCCADDYSGVVLSSEAEIRQLGNAARRLMQQDDTMLDPEFFLASISEGWGPKLVAVRKSHDVAPFS